MKLTAFLLTVLLAGDSTPFVFPESKRYLLLLKEKAEINEVLARESGCPDGEEFCEVPLSYPSSKIARALEKVDSSFMRSLLNTTVDTEEQDLARDIAVTEFRQEHAEHRLVALDEKGEQLVMETFMFPS